MKKILALLLAFAMVFGLVACGTKDEASAPEKAPAATNAAEEEVAAPAESGKLPYEGITLKWWTMPETDAQMEATQKQIAAFKELTGAEVQVTYVPWEEVSTKFISGFMSGDGPDVLYTTVDNIIDLIDSDLLVDLNEHFTEEERAARKYWDACYMNGGQYAMPYYVELYTRGYAYNMDILAQVGVTELPTTYDELVDVALKIKEAGICEYPLMVPGNGGTEALLETFVTMLYTNGGSILNEDGTAPALNSEAALEAAQFLYDLVHTHKVLSPDCVSYDFYQVLDLFREGKAAMVTTLLQFISNQDTFFMTTDADGNATAYEPFVINANSGISDGTKPVRVNMNMDMVSVSAVSDNLDAAVALAKFLTSEENMSMMIGDTQFRSNLYVTSPYPEFKEDYILKAAEHAATPDCTYTTPAFAGVGVMWEAVYSNFQMLLMGELTPQECVDAMQAAAEAAMAG